MLFSLRAENTTPISAPYAVITLLAHRACYRARGASLMKGEQLDFAGEDLLSTGRQQTPALAASGFSGEPP